MTTTRTARHARALSFITMGVLAAVPVLPSVARATPEPIVVTFPKHAGHMIPVRHAGATSAPSTRSTPDHFSSDGGRGVDGKLEYFGGRVISNVKVYDILWGPTSTFDPAYVAGIGGFYQSILNSSYWTWLAEYDTAGLNGAGNNQPGSNQTIGAGSFAAVISIAPHNLALSLSAQDVGNEIVYQMGIGAIPPLDLDAAGNVNSIYMVDFPGTMTITDFGSTSCKDFCAEHQTMQITQGSTTYSVPYAIMPSQYSGACVTGGEGCGTHTQFENSTMIASHELAESVTDTEIGLAFGLQAPIAWYDAVDQQLQQGASGGEIGDICDGIAGSSGQYTVQKLWSNLNNACIDAAPLCNGTTQPPYCTPCAATDDGVGCSGATPVCETSATSPQVGECVACTATSACASGPAAFCNTTNDTCRGCMASDCTGSSSVCETSGAQAGRCVVCDSAHASACTGTTALCDPMTFTCVGCVTNATCSGGTPICDFDAQQCRACLSAADCGSQACETDTTSAKAGQCVPCTTNAECVGSTTGNVCTAGACVMGSLDAGTPPSMDAGTGKKDGGKKDAAVAENDATSGGGDGGAKASSGSSGGCSVGGGAKGDALGWLAMLGLVVAARRRRR